MESLTKNKQSRKTIEEMVSRSFQGCELAKDVDAVSEMKEGWFNVAYKVKLSDGRDTVLKIAPPVVAEIMTYEKNIMKTEANMMKLVGELTDVKVPFVYYYDDKRDICDSDYFFMELLTGDNYGNVKGELPEEVQKKIDFEIGCNVRKINNIPGKDYFGYEGNVDLRGATWKEAFLKMMVALLEDGKRKEIKLNYSYDMLRSIIFEYELYLEEVNEPRLVHWDLWDSNVFVKEGKVIGLLDFERALWGDPLMEAHFRTMEPEKLHGYGKWKFTKGEEIRCKLYDIYLSLIMIIESFYRKYDTDDAYNYGCENLSKAVDWLMMENKSKRKY